MGRYMWVTLFVLWFKSLFVCRAGTFNKNKPSFVWAERRSCVFLNTHSFLSWRFIYMKYSIKTWFMFTKTSEPSEISSNSFTHSVGLLFIYSALLYCRALPLLYCLSLYCFMDYIFLICLLNFIVKCFVMLSRCCKMNLKLVVVLL